MTGCAKCGTIESGLDVRYPTLDVATCVKHVEKEPSLAASVRIVMQKVREIGLK